ncbi:MAG: prephenate/arogenate dehydrogenase family protein [Sphingomonadales bacterium]
MSGPLLRHLAIIGMGLIGSSLARAVRQAGLADIVTAIDADAAVRATVGRLGLADQVSGDAANAVIDADLVMLATPVGAYAGIAETIGRRLKPGAIVSDVGSVKAVVASAVAPHLPAGVHLVPGHPVAGTEESGPQAGFAALFHGRWSILTPAPGTDENAVATVRALWQGVGAKVELMDAAHHDLVLAITSHVPHLIAYNIVGTASHLEEVTRSEVIKYSAGGFRDFTRIAASDPTMWRDVFLANRDAVLEMLGRFTEDLTALQRAIRFGDGEALFDLFSRTREIRRRIIDEGQDAPTPDFGRRHE